MIGESDIVSVMTTIGKKTFLLRAEHERFASWKNEANEKGLPLAEFLRLSADRAVHESQRKRKHRIKVPAG